MALKPEDVAAALTKARGMVSIAATNLGVSRTTIYNHMKEHAIVREAKEDAREATTDLAELKLFEAIKKGEPWAISMYLKTQGKKRGYVERQEVTGAEGGELTVRVIRDDE